MTACTATIPPKGAGLEPPACPNSPAPGLAGAPKAKNSPEDAVGAEAAAFGWPKPAKAPATGDIETLQFSMFAQHTTALIIFI